MVELGVRTWFGIVQTPGREFITFITWKNVYTQGHPGYIPLGCKIVPEHLVACTILGKGTEANLTMLLSREAPLCEQKDPATIRMAKYITVPAEMESLVVVVTLKCGLMTIERMQTAKPTNG